MTRTIRRPLIDGLPRCSMPKYAPWPQSDVGRVTVWRSLLDIAKALIPRKAARSDLTATCCSANDNDEGDYDASYGLTSSWSWRYEVVYELPAQDR